MEYRVVKHFTEKCVEIRFTNEPWSGWIFPVSEEPKKNYIYIPELGIYRRNTSIN